MKRMRRPDAKRIRARRPIYPAGFGYKQDAQVRGHVINHEDYDRRYLERVIQDWVDAGIIV